MSIVINRPRNGSAFRKKVFSWISASLIRSSFIFMVPCFAKKGNEKESHHKTSGRQHLPRNLLSRMRKKCLQYRENIYMIK